MKVIEKIRAMSAEELAEHMDKQAELPKPFFDFCEARSTYDEGKDEIVCEHNFDCKGCIRDWLESEVQE